jgi:DNA-binding NarL/FixJ family response regulator
MFLRYRRNKKQTLKKQKEIILERNRAEEQLNLASQKLNIFTSSFIDKNRKIEELEKVISSGLKQKENSINDIQLSIDQLKKTSILTDANWDDFTAIFKQVYPTFFDSLKSKYPKITPSEIRLLALSKLELENKQMALMLGVGSNAIRQIKSRFLKKYTTEEGTILFDLIKKI